MGMTDKQFNGFTRFIVDGLEEALEEKDEVKREEKIKRILENLRKTLEDWVALLIENDLTDEEELSVQKALADYEKDPESFTLLEDCIDWKIIWKIFKKPIDKLKIAFYAVCTV